MYRYFAYPLLVILPYLFSPLFARADFVSWTYNFGRSPVAVPAGGLSTGGLSLTDESTHQADGTSDIVATNIRAFSSATRNQPDTFHNAPYTLSLFLKDNASGQSTTLSFKGVFNGTISATSANVTTTFTAPLSETVKLGSNTYTVNLGNYSPPGPPDASNAGSISAHVAVDEFSPPPPPPVGGGGGGSPPPASAPEPSTLLLSCIGLSGVGLAAWRKWRGRKALSPVNL
jgi:hypothetical protein